MWWGREIGAAGWAILLYEWGYIPACVHVFKVEPWTPTVYALWCIGGCMFINALQIAIGSAPTRSST